MTRFFVHGRLRRGGHLQRSSSSNGVADGEASEIIPRTGGDFGGFHGPSCFGAPPGQFSSSYSGRKDILGRDDGRGLEAGRAAGRDDFTEGAGEGRDCGLSAGCGCISGGSDGAGCCEIRGLIIGGAFSDGESEARRFRLSRRSSSAKIARSFFCHVS